jgi:hypothetical protein
MHRDECNAWVITAVFGGDPVLALNGGEKMDTTPDNPVSPVAKAFEKARLNHALGKSPLAALDGWNEELSDAAPAPKPAKDFLKSSGARFEKVSAKIRELFGAQNMEVCEEMIEAAQKLRDAERAAMLAEV